jgi:hypothetical protein
MVSIQSSAHEASTYIKSRKVGFAIAQEGFGMNTALSSVVAVSRLEGTTPAGPLHLQGDA